MRQSTLRQVLTNTESTARQYALRQKAVALGWPAGQVITIDVDQGQSGALAADREGFQRLVTEVGMGRAGIVLGLEVSRLARSNADSHRLLEICALTGTLICDEDGLYDPGEFNDRRASILFHSGQVDAADQEFTGADKVFRDIVEPDERLVDLMYFVRSIIAASRKSPQAEQVLSEATQFSRRRGVTWARIGFEGWLVLYLVSVGRLDEARALLDSAFAECTEAGDLRSSVFLHVGLARLRLAAGDYDAIIESSREVLSLASEYGEDHNRAHHHLAVSEAYMHKHGWPNPGIILSWPESCMSGSAPGVRRTRLRQPPGQAELRTTRH